MEDAAGALGFGRDDLDEYRAYEGARRDPRTGWGLGMLTLLGALVAGYLLAVSISSGRSAAVVEDQRKGELVELVRDQREQVLGLTSTLAELGDELSAREEEAAARVPLLDAALSRAEARAGLTPVTGPGVEVTLFDAPADCSGAPYLCRIQDYDLQQVVNTLFGAGAEAVSVGTQRVVATTAIRAAGSQITANYRFLTPPYVLRAVGDPDRLAAAMDGAGLAVALESAGSGLRMEVRRVGEVEIPGMTNAPAIRVARPVASAS